MKIIKKNIMYFNHILHMTFSNIPRLILSVSGLFVGLLVLAVGSILMDTYYNELRIKAEAYSNSAIMLNVSSSEEQVDNIIDKVGNEVWRNITGDSTETIYNKQYTNKYNVALNANVMGTSPMTGDRVLMNYDDDVIIPIDAKLVSGRWINGQDLVNKSQVIVIDEFTARLLFGSIACEGQTVEFGVNEPGKAAIQDGGETEERQNKKYEVIGVFEGGVLTNDNKLQLKKFQKSGRKNIILDTRVYIPFTTYKDNYLEEKNTESFTREYLIWKVVDEDIADINIKLEEAEALYSSKCDEYNIVTKKCVMENLEKEIMPVKSFMIIILLALFIISGINSMNIMFFSIKERIGEIGIKKAMGASGLDIVLQFLLEGLITSYIAGVIAAFLAGAIAKIIGVIIENKLFISFNVIYSKDTLVLIFIITTLYSFIFSFLPSFYGARSKVTDSLRFE